MEEKYSGVKVWSRQDYEEKVNKYKCKYNFVLKDIWSKIDYQLLIFL
jgi:hypothetical protein